MISISEILNANRLYDEENTRLKELYDKTVAINEQIDIEEIKAIKYAEIKDLYNLLQFRINNKNLLDEIINIKEQKKLEEYPEILDVHYYPEIKEIDFLTKDEKINLDIILQKAYSVRGNYGAIISDLDDKIKYFLISKNILRKQYIFHCTCDGDECFDKVITQEYFDKLKIYWEKERNNEEITDEEDKELNYGCFETGCWNDGSLEIHSLDTWNKHLRRIEYKVIKKPDMSLDVI